MPVIVVRTRQGDAEKKRDSDLASRLDASQLRDIIPSENYVLDW